jgi:hypothetical protein
MRVLAKKSYCTLCEDGAFGLEHDLRSRDYEKMAQHVQPGIRGIRTRASYQRLLKRNGLSDDVNFKEMRRFVLREAKPKRERVLDESIQRVVNKSLESFNTERDRMPVRTEFQRALRQRIERFYARR